MNKVNRLAQIAKIAERLNGKIEISKIEFSQILQCEMGQSVNDLLFVHKAHGVYFYTSKADLERVVTLKTRDKLPSYVGIQESNEIFKIS